MTNPINNTSYYDQLLIRTIFEILITDNLSQMGFWFAVYLSIVSQGGTEDEQI
jgi:hypothetical protein